MSKECIEREAAKRALRIWITGCVLNGDNESADRFRDCIDILDSLDTADVAPVRHGRWLTWEEQFPAHIPSKKSGLGVFCSTCHKHADNMYDYCPNCGAKMDGEEKSASDGGADNALRGDET